MLTPYEGNEFKVSQAFTLGVHNGLDIVGLDSKTLLALCDATVKQSRIVTDKSDKTWEWGNYVTLQTADGTQIVYAHLSSRLVSAGQNVKQGEPIGVEGNTGYSFGSHCHLEVRNSSNKVTSTCNTPAFTGIPNTLQTISTEKESEDMTKDETNALIDEKIKNLMSKKEVDIAITNALRSNNNELIEKLSQKVYHTWDEIKTELPWAYDDLLEMHKLGVFSGNSDTDLGVTKSEIKSLVWMYRLKNK